MELTAAQRYISRLYEDCVDRSLDVEAIRVHLAARGLLKTPAQVRYDLDHVYSFSGYAEGHPAPAKVTLRAADNEIERLPKSTLNRATSSRP